MLRRALFALLVTATPSAAEVASVASPPTQADGTAVEPTSEPSADELAAAPPADGASGIAIGEPREKHNILNTLLAIPRVTARVLLTGPRYAAAEIDEYLENKSPNAFARDVQTKATWRFGATLEYEQELQLDLAARVGRQFGPSTAVDGYVGFFGARGQSGGLRASLGRYTAARLEPVLTIDAGRDMDRVFAGLDSPGPVSVYEQRAIAGAAALGAHVGWFGVTGRIGADRSTATDGGDVFVANYNPLIRGYDETQRATTGELEVAYDSRRVIDRWIPRAAPSTGFLARATGSYTSGTASRTGDFAFARGTLELRRLFNLFRGNRVLSLGGHYEVINKDLIPFDRYPSLGGRDRMRAFAREELRGVRTGYVDLQYEWPLGSDSRAYIFGELGGATLDAWPLLHGGYGGGIRLLSGSSTSARIQVAGSDTGDVGVFFQLGAL